MLAGYLGVELKTETIRTLVLDDNRQMRRLISVTLEAFGIKKIYGADTIEEATGLYRDHRFDLVIADQRMGKTSGLEFVRWVRAQPDRSISYVPVIVISSYSEKTRIIEAINAGIDEFLVKPFKPVDLARRIDAVTFKRRDFIRTLDYFGPDRRRFKNPHYTGPMKRADDVVADYEEFEIG